MIDFQDVLDNLTNEDVISIVKSLGANNYIERESHIVFPTICHNFSCDNASMKLYFYKDSKLFKCYTECDDVFSIFDLVAKVFKLRDENLNFSQSIDFVLRKIDFNFESFNEKYESKREKYKKFSAQLPIIEEGILSVFSKFYPSNWLEEGIEKSVMDKYHILFSQSRNKIIIPHYNRDSELVGIRGRALNQYEIDEGKKYMPVTIEGKIYSHPLSLNLYGLNIAKKEIKKRKALILFEGEKSVLLYDTYFKQSIAAAVCGNSLNKHQLNLIKDLGVQEIILAFDKEYENAFDKKALDYWKKLRNMCLKYNRRFNFSIIYDTQNVLKYKDSPIDRGPDIFEELLKKRIKVR